jgi:hypothetical protein
MFWKLSLRPGWNVIVSMRVVLEGLSLQQSLVMDLAPLKPGSFLKATAK